MAIFKYPKHFYDPIRIEIAVSQMQHDFKKLFPSLNSKDRENIEKNIVEWFQGEEYELEPVHDFWNFFCGVTRGLKLKSLASWITAENVSWREEFVKLSDIVITWDFPGLDFMGKAPYKVSDVKTQIFSSKNEKVLKKIREDSHYRSQRYTPRDHFPVILLHDPKGGIIDSLSGYYILEGNRRIVKAIVENKDKINSYVGRLKDEEKWPKNYWVSTGILRDLIFLAINYEKEGDERAFNVTRNFYQLLLRDFDLARVATIDKSFKNFEKNERLQKELLSEDMK
jgi:hypothetical protein